ncbi:dipeptidyl peptidase 1 isoform X1 [Strongylocentrotus purpuratus]|uniref:Dipeptidyl peptidase 1 n=1 Tax=Strongylocentrotus purpuratus TaxID=7668 RepID=A0A7M7HQ28_STRPU|nr:dipeptidyl peptidase 1 isoform X1 [Strongylocentrotus purpuratus]|eukprot:XP_011676840.1 PREDICTED: dipeptidyl peptidase 1 isoform X1 [Strongylocentrotus purpuratus]
MRVYAVIFMLAVVPAFVVGDTPANCTYEDVAGEWIFEVSGYGGDNKIDCTKPGPVTYKLHVQLLFPDVAVDVQYGTKGFWTLIYNQGFEVVLNNRKYFAFSEYTQQGSQVTMNCSQTLPGWSHNVIGSDWACYVGSKVGPSKVHTVRKERRPDFSQMMYRNDKKMVEKINRAQKSWNATIYPEHEMYTVEDMRRRAGAMNGLGSSRPAPAIVTNQAKRAASSLPPGFDWRNVNGGQNFVSPVRNQASCGSCYAFGSLAMLESRLRIATNNSIQLVFSTQDVVSCSEYSQGCEGGFPYLVAGKYAEDFGVVEESCYPYEGTDISCSKEKAGCRRYYATNYNYVGGFYGGCKEELMRTQLVKNGPLAVSFMVYDDFMAYSGGIYHHTGVKNENLKFNPFEITNHVVLVVGYGVEAGSGEKFWIVKNSWGEGWGEEGYFRIRRGTDECAIESIAVEAFPIYP